MADSRTIVVAGAGIGGLTAALALAARGFRVIVLERAEKLQEAGAGLQLSPNASRILMDLGLEPLLAPHVIAPDSISIMTARTGKEIGRIPLGEAATYRYGAPYWIVRRADLQAALVARVTSHPDIDLRLGAQFEDVAVYPKGVTVVQRRVTARQQEQALALIGADGVWSSVRLRFSPRRSRNSPAHCMARHGGTPRQLPRGSIRIACSSCGNERASGRLSDVGRQAHQRGGDHLGQMEQAGLERAGDVVEIANHFSAPRWPIAARMMIGAVDGWRKWALFAMRDGGVWNKGPIALLGDASHAMLPFAAQGAGMAIEDAAVIAKCLESSPTNPTAAFAQYAGLRGPRVTRVQRTARKNGQRYHLGGPVGFARDQVIRVLGGSRLLSQQDWIYDWRMP